MSRRRVPVPARLVVSAIFREERHFEESLQRIVDAVGEIRPEGGRRPFAWTEYYEREMGSPLFRRFLTAATPVERDALPDIKVRFEKIERGLSEEGRRTVNLDPGLVTAENFVLATGKNYSHRIYLRDGVFADLTLLFRGGEYRALPWTYPDYASDEVRALLSDIRRAHLS